MQNKFSLLFIVILLSASILNAQHHVKQPRILAKADRLYNRFYYLTAAELYQKAWEKDTNKSETALQLARCYYQLREVEKSATWYEHLQDSLHLFTTEDKLYFAQVLEGTGQISQAKKWYQAYGEDVKNTQQVQSKVNALSNRDIFYKDSAFYSVVPVNINSKQPDFSPTYWGNGIVFVSARDKGFLKKSYGWNDQPFLDLYYSEIQNNAFAAPQKLHKQINSRYHEGPAAFYSDGRKMIFTRNNYYEGKTGKSSEGVNKLKLFTAEQNKNSADWTNIQPFPYNSDEYSVGHPTVTADGTRLYFVSDMPGGLGGTDLYVSYWQGQRWSEPHNLEAPINTEGNEMFPFIHSNGHLYFSSDGHGGLGGLDIFRARLSSGKADTVENMGSPINSNADDFGLIFNENQDGGYFASNRVDKAANDDLYQFSYYKPKHTTVSGTVVFMQDQQPLSSVVIVKDTHGNEVAKTSTGSDGRYLFNLYWDQSYHIIAQKDGYSVYQQSVITDKAEQIIDLPLDQTLLAQGSMMNKETGKPLQGAKLVLLDLNTQEKQEQLTDASGHYTFILNPDHQYKITSEVRKYFRKSIEFDPKGQKNGIIPLNFTIEEIILNKAIALEKIYYDLGKWDIQPDAALELDKLVKLLNDNPTIEVELRSHTDSRGSDSFNFTLSDKRAKAAAAYIISQGIDKSRIVGKGYGETSLVNKCMNRAKCSEEEHQQNRRTEFAVTKF